MGRVLAIDYGSKRIGLAVTDKLQMIANPLDTIPAHEAVKHIVRYCEEEDVELVVVGQPKRMNNEFSEIEESIVKFVAALEKKGLKIKRVDERFTSKMAFQAMIDGGLKKKDRRDKSIVDKVSATIILQTYLENKAL